MQPITEDQYREAVDIARELPRIADRLMRAGLLETANLLREGPMQQIGYEIEERSPFRRGQNVEDET